MLALWGFAVATAYLPTIYSAPFMPRWWAVAMGIGCVSRFDPRDVAEPILWCLGSGLLWAALTLLWSPVLDGGALPVVFLVLFGLVLIASASATQEDRDNGLSGFALAILLSAGIALAQKYGDLQGIIETGPHEPVGLFFNPEIFAEGAAPIAVWCLLQKTNAHRAIGGIIGVAACCGSERVAVFGLIAGLLYGIIRNPKVLIGLLALLFVGGFLSLALKIFDSDERILLWGTAIRSVTFFGRGIGWWYQAHPFGREEYVHSDVLQLLVEAGVPGLALCAVPALAWFNKRGTRAERAAFVVCAVEFITSFPLHMPATSFVFAMLAGALACRRADVYIPGLQSRAASGFGLGSAAARGRSLFGRGRWRGEVVSVRSAHPQHADVSAAISSAGGAVQCRQ